MKNVAELVIPQDLKPSDGRFGSGPTKIRPEALHAIVERGNLMGTSHRQAPVKNLVAAIQEKIAALYQVPADYQVVLGNGGATCFWDVACCSLIEKRSAHGVFGEFSRKFFKAANKAPFLAAPAIFEAEVGDVALPEVTDADLYAWAQNETSTGACAPVCRPAGIAEDELVLIDATSAAGGMAADLSQVDAYYFSPQKNFSSDGGLWLAVCSPAALARAERLCTDQSRWVPDSLNLATAASNSVKHQTLNTPAIATLILLDEQLSWLLELGGMAAVVERTSDSSNRLYSWAQDHEYASCFVTDAAKRSPVVGTIDFDERVDAAALCKQLRTNGIVDVEPYRSLGRNQIRVGMYAAIEPEDVTALTRCVDWLIDASLAC